MKNRKYGFIIGFLVLVVLDYGGIYYNGSTTGNNTQPVKTYSANGVSFNYPGDWHVNTDNVSGGIMILVSPDYSVDDLFSVSVCPFSVRTISLAPWFQLQIIPNNEFSINNGIPHEGMPNNNPIFNDTIFSNDFFNDTMHSDVFLNYSSMPNNVSLSEQEIINQMQNSEHPDGWYEISNKTLTIDGKTAYEKIFIVYSLIPPIVDRRFEEIYFVKNGKTYLMLFEAQDWDFDKEKTNFDIILNSFKVQ
ncbi:MAG: hypothetical protein FJ150_06455 [Euryarchaeota archaeon]|nr:hypothetical protein [Euryarchaeota archaeon]